MKETKKTLSIDTDADTINHFIDLREHILETVSCIFSAIKHMNKTKEFLLFSKQIMEYINSISGDSLCWSFSILIQGLILISDLYIVYQSDLVPLLKIETIKKKIKKIESDKKIYSEFAGELKMVKDKLNMLL